MLRTWRQRVTLIDIMAWAIGIAIAVVVVIGTIKPLESGKYAPSVWLDLTVKGLALGGVYALIAMGYTLVYGILKMINFAHSEVVMSGPFTAVFLANSLARSGYMDKHPLLGMLLVTVLSMATATVVAILLERIAYRPLRAAPRLVPLITAIGASFFLQYVFRGLYGSGFQAYPTLASLHGALPFFGIQVFKSQIVVIVGALLMMVILYAIVQWTKIGKAMRAVSEDKEAAELMGDRKSTRLNSSHQL